MPAMKQPWPWPFPTHTSPLSPHQHHWEVQGLPQPHAAAWQDGPAASGAALPPSAGRPEGCGGTHGCAGAARPHCLGDGEPGGSAGAWWGWLSAGRAAGPGLGSCWRRQRLGLPSSSSAPRAAVWAAGAAQTHWRLCHRAALCTEGAAVFPGCARRNLTSPPSAGCIPQPGKAPRELG